MKLVTHGCTRLVLLAGAYAFKIPNFLNGWNFLLRGLLANMQETDFSRMRLKQFCPVRWSLWGGWLVVMLRARGMTEDEFAKFDFAAWRADEHCTCLVEPKASSFGWLNGRVVAVDYG